VFIKTNKTLLELRIELTKGSGYKINIQKSIVFLYNLIHMKIKENHSIHNRIQKSKKPGVVVHDCNLSYLGGTAWKDLQASLGKKVSETPLFPSQLRW
jgi:hypothetical protein